MNTKRTYIENTFKYKRNTCVQKLSVALQGVNEIAQKVVKLYPGEVNEEVFHEINYCTVLLDDIFLALQSILPDAIEALTKKRKIKRITKIYG
jgi:hypothetical protein